MAEKKLFYRHLRALYRLCAAVRLIDLYCHPSNYVWLWAIMRMVSVRLKIKHRTLLRHR
jgi:hypothetical protein